MGRDTDSHVGEFLALARPEYCGDLGESKPPPPTVPSVWHAGAMVGSGWDASTHCAIQEGGGAKETASGSGGGDAVTYRAFSAYGHPLDMVTSFK